MHLLKNIIGSVGLLLLGLTASLAADAPSKFKVATTFTVIADMARNVAGEHAKVVSITKPGAEIHFYQPTPKDIAQTGDADLILRNGLGLEHWFEQFLHNVGDVPQAVLTRGIKPLPIDPKNPASEPNPHAWMGTDEAMIYIDNIQQALSQHDPDHAAEYAHNAERYKQRIRQALAPARQQLEKIPPANRWLVSCEGAFGYLTRSLGFNELYLWPVNAEGTGTPKQIRLVIDAVRAQHIPAVFCESTVSPRPAQQVARDTQAQFGGVLYVDSLSKPDGPVPTYLDLLKTNLERLAQKLAP